MKKSGINPCQDECDQHKTYMFNSNFRTEPFINLWVNENLCIAYRVELPSEIYELMSEAEGELAEGKVSYTCVQQDLDQSPEEPKASAEEEGKPRLH